MTQGLPLSDIVNVSVTLEPQATSTRNFGSFLILGDSKVLDNKTLHLYESLDALATDGFTVDSPEYNAAKVFFAQSPQPSTLYIARMDFEGTENDLRQAVLGLSQSSCDWYGLGFAFSKEIDNQQIVEVAKDIEGFSPSRTLWVTTRAVGSIQENSDNNLAYLLNKAKLSRTWCQYSSSNPYAAISAFARIATVDYTGENTTLTLKFKNEPTIESETLTSSQYKVLASRKCNVFVLLQNGESIIQEGYMSDGTWADTRIGVDSLQNNLQVAGFNLLYSDNKIPLTDEGMTTLKNAYDQVCQQYVTNGFFAPGLWDGPDIGILKTNHMLNNGYYIYAPPIATQSSADRAARKAVTMQIACKLAGAVHFSNLIVNVRN